MSGTLFAKRAGMPATARPPAEDTVSRIKRLAVLKEYLNSLRQMDAPKELIAIVERAVADLQAHP